MNGDQQEAAGFYAALAPGYDAMTGFAGRLAAAERFIQRLRQRRPPGQRLLDVATGTGVYAIAAARQGLAATGCDLSAEMLAVAADNAAAAGVQLPWVEAPMEALPADWAGRFDAVLCLGNSLPHLLGPAALARALAQFRAVLAPGGALCLQLLNYPRLLARQERMISADRQGLEEFIRFHDFLPDGLIRFNLLRLWWDREHDARTQWQSVTLRPWSVAELAAALRHAGLARVQLFGGLDFSPWQPEASETVLLLAEAGP